MTEGKVAVAMSGGKDSAAAVLLLKEQGYDVTAVSMTLGLPTDPERVEQLKVLCSVLDVPLQVIEFSSLFDRYVRLPFASAYLADQTPNPCSMCNREIKFGRFMDEALRISGAQFFATGHYAAVCDHQQRKFLCEPVEIRKSQIYFLALIDPQKLDRVVFPLAGTGIDQVRAMTRKLPLANRKESQDVCFLAGGRLADYLANELDADAIRSGLIVDRTGRVLGEHRGLAHYTIGQRRGVGLAAGKRLFVVGKDGPNNRLIMGEAQELMADRLRAVQPVYWRALQPGETLEVKIRYQTPAVQVRVQACNDQGFELLFDKPAMSVTPGQTAVLYQGQRIVAAAEIQ